MLTWVDDSADRVPSFGLWNAHLSIDDAAGADDDLSVEDYEQEEEKEDLCRKKENLPVCMKVKKVLRPSGWAPKARCQDTP